MRALRSLLAGSAILVALGPPAPAAAAPSLPLSAAEAPGLAGGAGAGAQARALLLARTPRTGRPAARRVPLQASLLRGPGTQLLSGVASYRTSTQATRAVSRWGGRRAVIGDGARLRTARVGRRAQVLAAVRVGDTVGFLRLTATGTPAAASRRASAYLASLAARILRLRGRPGEDRILKGIRRDGSVPPRVALQEFALLYGALPGVPRPAGPSSGRGTTAIAMALANRGAFTAAQRQAIDRRIEGGTVAARRGLRGPGDPVLTPSPQYQTLVDGFVAAYSALLGTALPFPVKTYTTPTQLGTSLADAFPTDNALKQKLVSPDQCRVRIFPSGKAANPAFFRLIVAHEVFHCFQFAVQPAWPSIGNWIMEGMADWAALTVVPSTAAIGGGNLATYFSTPTAHLTARVYDAVGFWGAVHQYVPGGLWPRVRPVLLGGGGLASFLAAGGDSPELRQAVASAMFRNGLGPAWRQTVPLLYKVPGSEVPFVLVTASGPLVAPALTNGVYLVRPPSGPKLVHTDNTSGFLRGGTQADEGDVNGAWFCVGGTCQCKAGEDSAIPPHKEAFTGVVLGFNGGSQTAVGSVQVRDPKEFCTKKQKPKPGAPSGPAESNGDPHLTTMDALHYDFQAAGEFTLVRSRSGDLEIQARQEQLRAGDDVTVDTMFGLRLDGHRVTIVPTSGDPAVRLDGAPVALADGATRAVGGGSLGNDGGWVLVRWPDGSGASVRSVGRYGLAITLALADARRGQVAGLLGDFDGAAGNDLATRGGKRIAYTTVDARYGYPRRVQPKQENTRPFFDALYDTVGESWRIAQAQSLMDYGPGQSTKTFTDRAVPSKPIDAANLSRARRQRAEAICREAGVTDPGPLEDCILDVGATGRRDFAEAAAEALQAARAPWSRLQGTTTISGRPWLARTPDGSVHIVHEDRKSVEDRSLLDLRIAPDGREQPPVTITRGDVNGTAAVGPDGSLTTFYDAIKDNTVEPSSGIYRASAAPPWAAWTEGPAVTGYGYSYADEPVGTVLGDGTALVVSGMAGHGRIFRSGPVPDPEGALLDPDPDCYATSPAVTTDAAGGAWASWYRWDCAQTSGPVAARVDPATGRLAGPTLLAPGAHWSIPNEGDYDPGGLAEHMSIAAAAGQPGGVVAYYARTGVSAWEVRLWRIGDAQPTVIARESGQPRELRLSAEPSSGRLWVGWQRADGRYRVAHTQARSLSLEGTVALMDAPRDADGGSSSWLLVAEDGAATVVHARVNGQDGKDALWRLQLRG